MTKLGGGGGGGGGGVVGVSWEAESLQDILAGLCAREEDARQAAALRLNRFVGPRWRAVLGFLEGAKGGRCYGTFHGARTERSCSGGWSKGDRVGSGRVPTSGCMSVLVGG